MSEAELDLLLLNWSRWARSDPHRLDYPEPPVFRFWMPRGDSRDPGWGDEDASPVPADLPIDILRAEALDPLLLRLRRHHWKTLRRHYLWERRCDWEDLGAARRALLDLIETNPVVYEILV